MIEQDIEIIEEDMQKVEKDIEKHSGDKKRDNVFDVIERVSGLFIIWEW